MQYIKRRRKVLVAQMWKLDRDQLPISLGTTSFRPNRVRFNRCLGPYHYDRTSKPKLSHYLVTEIVAYSETCVPPDLPALGLQHRCELQRQRSICFGVADKDICHGRAHGPENPHASK